MKKINTEQKNEIYGGISASLLWVALVGSTMAISTISNIVTSVTDSFNGKNSSTNQSNKTNGYIRAGMMPMRSAVTMPF